MKFNCKYCGATNDVYENYSTCPKCRHRYLVPKKRDEKFIRAFERGDFFLRKHYFEKAFSIFENLLKDGNENDPAILWSLMLAQFGVGYEMENGKEKLYIHKLQFSPLKAPGTFHFKAMASAESILQKHLMEEETEKIVDAFREEMNSTRLQPPYDVYITCREKGFSGKESMEHKMAVKLYNALTKLGYTVFSPEVTNEDMSHGQREPLVFAATNMAKVMIVLGSKPEAFTDVWVKSAWTRFLEVLNRGAKKQIIPCYMNIEAYELPDQLFPFKSFDFSKEGALEAIVKEVNTFALPTNSPVEETVDNITESKADEVEPKAEEIEHKAEETKAGDADSVNTVSSVAGPEEKAQASKPSDTDSENINNTAIKKETVAKEVNKLDLPYVGLGYHNYRKGELVCFGSYPQEDATGELKDLIVWRVLHVTTSKMLIISENVLDCKPFSKIPVNVLDVLGKYSTGTDWENSDLRKWMNNDFVNTAFNESDRSIILERANTSGRDESEICYDNAFCLSLSEVNTYLKFAEERKAKTTPYAKAKGAYRSPKGNSWWWLRSPGDNPNFAAGVDAEGSVFAFGVDVSSGRYGVRPAMWVSID